MITELPRLHAVTDDRVIAAGGVITRAAAMAEAAGPALAVHLRSRTLEGGAMLGMARELSSVLTAHGSWLVINGRADIARAAKARGMVLGRGALSVLDARRVAPSALVMRSVHDEAEIRGAANADALIASKEHQVQGAGAEVVRRAVESGKPVIGIGGVTPANAGDVISAGAWGVAAIRALWDTPSSADAVREFLAVLPRDESVAVTINGEQRRAPAGTTLARLLESLGLDARAVVVEHNRRIVRQGALEQTPVEGGDAIELVHFVGGG